MPFTFLPLDIRRHAHELELRGRLLTGAYLGPELVVVRSRSGEVHRTAIRSHAIESPQGWPVLPEHHNTVLILFVPHLPEDSGITGVEGVGPIESTTGRVDMTDALREPEFWGYHASLHFASENVDEPNLEWLGVRSETANEWYESRIDSQLRAGRSLYVRVVMPGSRYIELEMAGGVEYQDRIWIGQSSGSSRVLIGYHSGHFSLPALRPSEILSIASETNSDVSNLLWLSGVHLENGSEIRPLVDHLVSGLPGLITGKKHALTDTLLKNLTVPNVSWTLDSDLGWINNGTYSQRNPDSKLSLLKRPDFDAIRQFFGPKGSVDHDRHVDDATGTRAEDR